MNEKVCLITGATSGIGEVTARVLAEMGATVVVAARNRRKAERTVAEIRERAGHDRVDYLLADFASQVEIRRLAADFREQYERLDVLVNNAGAVSLLRQETEEGIEITFAVNHLGYFLLTNLLLDVLKESSPARIINVSSAAHHSARLDFDNLQLQHGYGGMKAYGLSKLANILFTIELARRLEGSGVTANSVHPGWVATNIGANNIPWVGGLLKGIINLTADSPEKGAKTNIYLAASAEAEGISGKYFVNCKAARPSAAARDEEAARRLWEMSAELVGIDPE
jgi:NAD(P)-dependent dehydrogenase (short-subunit alcohol dehydrogenase family)